MGGQWGTLALHAEGCLLLLAEFVNMAHPHIGFYCDSKGTCEVSPVQWQRLSTQAPFPAVLPQALWSGVSTGPWLSCFQTLGTAGEVLRHLVLALELHPP